MTVSYFDGWYADMTAWGAKDELMRRHLGLPSGFLSTSALPWDGIADVVGMLRLSHGERLLDLACGRAGYGIEVSRRTGARLVGVDFSAEALRRARETGPEGEFRLGDLVATGLDDHSVDAAMCIDAVQFSMPPDGVYAELRRVLAPGGRVVLTCWEPLLPGDERLPERLRRLNLRDGLTAAGFTGVEVGERADWRGVERGLYEEVAALDPGDDPALRSLHEEGIRALETFGLVRRVVATAVS